MNLKRIYSRRLVDCRRWWHLVWEWEDDFCSFFGLPLTMSNRPNRAYSIVSSKFARKFPKVASLLCPHSLEFRYEMYPSTSGTLLNAKHIIPCIIDYYLCDDQIENMINYYRDCPILLISSKEVYCHLMNNESINKSGLKIAHFPLSISNRYQIEKNTLKKYDVAILGRTNPILLKFLIRYKEDHPNLRYIIRSSDVDGNVCIDQNGRNMGFIESREDYIKLMRQTKVALYATPGIDGGEERCHGFSQVTPRLLEHIACGNHIIARYIKNADTDYYELENFAHSIDNYEQFKEAMDFALTHDIDVDKYNAFLAKHYTLVRARQLQEIIADL